MQIGWVPSPREWSRWPEAEELLKPAAALADEPMEVLPEHHLLWAVMDGDDLLAVATTRMTTDKRWEVPLIGGRDFPRWIAELSRIFGAAAAEAGATHMTAMGRRGWWKTIKRLGWVKCGEDADGIAFYSREV